MSFDPDAAPRPPVHVVAAVLEDLRGRVLLTRRTSDRDFAGLWEFPGGKVEPGETPLDALAREIHEELGITIGPATPVIRVPCAVASNATSATPAAQRSEAGSGTGLATPRHKRLLLDVHRVTSWTGRPHGREQQATIWVPRDRLHRYAMPPADRPVVAALTLPPLMLVTPEPDPDALPAFVDALLDAVRRAPKLLAQPVHPSIPQDARAGVTLQHERAGAGPVHEQIEPTPSPLSVRPEVSKGEPPYGANTTLLLQLRAKTLTTTQRRDLATSLARLLPNTVTLLVNGDREAAQGAATGLHLTAAQLASARARPIARNRLLGASCHSAEDLARAEALDCDYAVLGPVAATATHPDATPLGWPAFAALREQASLPIYAIGGLSPTDLCDARAHGAQGIAAIRSLWPG